MNLVVFGLIAFVFGESREGLDDTGSIWLKFKGSENAKEYDIDHPIFQENSPLRNAICDSENKNNNPVDIPFNERSFDIVAGLFNEEEEAGDAPISFGQLLHTLELVNYLCFADDDQAKSINDRLLQKTLDGEDAENAFAATNNDEVHMPLRYFLCLKAYAKMHGLHTCITNSFAVTICAHYDRAYGSIYDNLSYIDKVRILPEIYDQVDEHVGSTILKICKNAGMKNLDVSGCRLTPNDVEQLGQMTSLQCLNLSGVELSENSIKEIFKLASLEELIMVKCSIQMWYEFNGIENMTSLKHLNLTSNDLKNDNIKMIFELTNLETLIMMDCGMEKWYEFNGIENMASLKHLNIRHNRLSNDSMKAIFKVASLKELIMRECSINKQYGFGGIDKMTSLTYLDLNDNKLSKGSMTEIFKLVNLEKLMMENCGIEKDYSLEGISNLTKLVHLEIGIDSLNTEQKEFIRSLRLVTRR